ncbi:MAG: methylated-DNA--[protein]-cysteine S-methyltransferase [Planctomycetota bacterium]|jgi:AraC family transcriptional regulator of adaptative response/methylated-DNA-[protein]-cysteine methyltransferase|nr:methylated-DNA--[protein]-cysteine S-methyltransferase [Planctomycetota bacterium]
MKDIFVERGKAGDSLSAAFRREGKKPLAASFATPLGTMAAIACGDRLISLSFLDPEGWTRENDSIRRRRPARRGEDEPEAGENSAIRSLRKELADYFAGRLRRFATPVAFFGTPFQLSVWKELRRVPFGETISYLELARRIGHPRAVRAVGQANGANRLPILAPCHRVIANDGGLGGFSSGLERKKWLLEFEKGRRFGTRRGEGSRHE